MFLRSAFVLVALASCSSKGEAPKQEPPPPAPPDAPVDSITEIGANDPDRFTDPDPARRPGTGKPGRHRPSRPIDIILKSSPPGASAAVDGVVVGRTPAYWYGEADGNEHEFTFVLPGHAVGRYRFVPIQSGTVHARLELISEDIIDAGVDPVTSPKQPTFTPDPTPSPMETPKPPDTVITPGSGSAPLAPGSGSAPTPGSAAGSGSARPRPGSGDPGDFSGFPGMGPTP